MLKNLNEYKKTEVYRLLHDLRIILNYLKIDHTLVIWDSDELEGTYSSTHYKDYDLESFLVRKGGYTTNIEQVYNEKGQGVLKVTDLDKAVISRTRVKYITFGVYIKGHNINPYEFLKSDMFKHNKKGLMQEHQVFYIDKIGKPYRDMFTKGLHSAYEEAKISLSKKYLSLHRPLSYSIAKEGKPIMQAMLDPNHEEEEKTKTLNEVEGILNYFVQGLPKDTDTGYGFILDAHDNVGVLKVSDGFCYTLKTGVILPKLTTGQEKYHEITNYNSDTVLGNAKLFTRLNKVAKLKSKCSIKVEHEKQTPYIRNMVYTVRGENLDKIYTKAVQDLKVNNPTKGKRLIKRGTNLCEEYIHTDGTKSYLSIEFNLRGEVLDFSYLATSTKANILMNNFTILPYTSMQMDNSSVGHTKMYNFYLEIRRYIKDNYVPKLRLVYGYGKEQILKEYTKEDNNLGGILDNFFKPKGLPITEHNFGFYLFEGEYYITRYEGGGTYTVIFVELNLTTDIEIAGISPILLQENNLLQHINKTQGVLK